MPLDPSQRERVHDDLRGIVRGDLLFGELDRALYSTDASIFQVEPLGVVAPADEEDLQTLVRYAHANLIPLIPRGAGTGLAGESLGSGVVVDLSRHFRQIREMGSDTVRVQPGVVLQKLNAELALMGRRFAPDPSSAAACTIGGMLATDASGARLRKYGYTRDHVASLRVVLDSGDAVGIAREPRSPSPDINPRLREVIRGTAEQLDRHAELIRAAAPFTPFNRCGYRLIDILGPSTLDLHQLLIGSEGTLALFSEATLKTMAAPGGRSVVLCSFASLEAAIAAVPITLADGPSACDLIDRRLLSLARSQAPMASRFVPAEAEAVLLIEFECDRVAEAKENALSLARRLPSTALSIVPAYEPEVVDLVWQLREVALPTLFSMGRGHRPVAFVEDIGVPPYALAEFLSQARQVLLRHDVTASFLVHAATGQVHIRPFVDLSKPDETARLSDLAEDLYSAALEFAGTISTQHGTGIARSPWVERQFGPLYSVFRDLKAVFDPRGILNPGKIVDPMWRPPAWPLRHMAPLPVAGKNGSVELPLLTNSLIWPAGEFERQVTTCNGCGDCRVESAGSRMCPLFRVSHAEEASPRAKANLLRHLLSTGDPSRLTAGDVRDVADLCINCKMCAGECPARVNIPKLMLETKAAHVAEHGMTRADWALARTEGFAAIGSRLALFVNPLLTNPAARWLLERVLGISRHRRLPPFAGLSFLKHARRRGWTTKPPRTAGSSPRVAYFVDVYANYNDPSIAEAVVAVLKHNGCVVVVPEGQRGCGIAPLARGDVETAREAAIQNLRVLSEFARDGYQIVCSEPSAALMFKQDYRDILDDPDVQFVADQTMEFMTYLGELHKRRQLRTDFLPVPIAVGHHVPCHIKALGAPAGPDILSLIPRFIVHTIDEGCSGMAGTFGLNRWNYHLSLEAGRPMLDQLRRPKVLAGSSECSACRMQMEEGTGKRTLHPAQYLAIAYGLMPELARRVEP
jgi:FAD/FMN-containing dehydrogenase/Fe-S oxidoreductase